MGALLLATSSAVLAQYPERPVKIVNPFAVGGSVDTLQRLFAQKLSERTGQRFIVENKTGAGGRIGYDYVAKSRGDGYTLVAGDPGYAVLGALYPKLPWDHANDLVPVTTFARAPFAIVTNPQSRFKTLPALLAYARANPGKVTYGSPGTGTLGHFVMEAIQREAKVTLTHVPYKGGSDALAAVMGNNVDIVVTGIPTIVGQMKNGLIVVLATTSENRWPGAERVPTMVEQGVNVATYFWYGLMAPKGTPGPTVDFLYQQVVNILKDPATKEALDAQGVEGSAMKPAELANLVREETKRWTEVVRSGKISVE
ncbi:Argininosuccinate lyase (plasmid) [Variovorax sp. SRS16]|uniref:Bug family tripartite tricarboxylate transporter substrate binding protein n=1 Tax=Variovorax sp. SRS16 TaxID=282217 RepID=UPI001318C47E|nr:tripartite tricarboxylate transporter substrate binding protein [Variovorax sp. SRS16]VTU45380.1 Argininosuccinate lyase [Variovorax sp. SRS16]